MLYRRVARLPCTGQSSSFAACFVYAALRSSTRWWVVDPSVANLVASQLPLVAWRWGAGAGTVPRVSARLPAQTKDL